LAMRKAACGAERIAKQGGMPQVLSAQDRCALEILTGNHNGCIEDELRLLGCTEGVIDALLRAGFATVATRRIGTKHRPVKVRRIRITGAGRPALEG
jgi:hypothetical protein